MENDNNLYFAISVGICFLKAGKKVDADTWNTITLGDNSSRLVLYTGHPSFQISFCTVTILCFSVCIAFPMFIPCVSGYEICCLKNKIWTIIPHPIINDAEYNMVENLNDDDVPLSCYDA